MAHTTTREQKTRMLCTAGLMAALACVSNFISIATPASRIHIGNAVCVLCGLILGPAYGFFAAGVGNAIFDIIGGYGMEFVITFINKGAIALVTGPAVLVLGGLTDLWLPALVAMSVLILGDALNERSA